MPISDSVWTLSAKTRLVWRYWWEASELDWMESTLELLNDQSVLAWLLLEVWKDSAEKGVKVRSDCESSLWSVPLNPTIPLSSSFNYYAWIQFPSDIFFYGYWCLFFIFFSFLSLLWLCFISSGLSPVMLSDSLQMDVVSAFQSGTSFQGALRRQASNSSQQQHDVTNVSSPTHVAFSTTTTTATAANTASATVGCECVFSSSAWDFLFLLFF